MQSLSQNQFKKEALPVLHNIFKNFNPYNHPFAPEVGSKLILHEYWYVMDRDMFEIVKTLMKQYKESGFYVSIIIKYLNGKTTMPSNWFIPVEVADEYYELDKYFIQPAYNIVYSESGRWGILGSDEHFGLFGGTHDFVNQIRNVLPKIDQQVYSFLEEWQLNKIHFNSNTKWLPKLLSNVYSPKQAQQLLSKYNLP